MPPTSFDEVQAEVESQSPTLYVYDAEEDVYLEISDEDASASDQAIFVFDFDSGAFVDYTPSPSVDEEQSSV